MMRSSGREPPAGIITLVFTDIEGSTRLVQALGDRWTTLLQQHREIMRTAWGDWNGFEMGTEGDSFFVSFSSASDAVAAAVQAQRALAAHPWPEDGRIRVRIGMHTGEPSVVGGDYVGVDVHRAARIAAAGHGGQVVLSKETRDLVERSLPDGVTLIDLGEHRLKDLDRPEWVFQLDIAGLSRRFASLKSLETPSNLPVLSGAFIGREEEQRTVAELLERDDVRVVTLTGPGGTGKTRLGIHIASEMLERFLNGVFFVPIGPATEAGNVPSEIARTLQLSDIGQLDVVDALAAHVRNKSMLFLLDNFEHVLDAAPSIGRLLASAPRVKIIVTSRAPLRLSGEREFPVAPLGLPPEAQTVDEVSASPAVTLFVERARAVRPDFALTPANIDAVASICRRLDGLPLAIELAASKVRLLSPEQILERLGSRLSLKGGARDLPARQQTLRDTISWSYELLERPAARAFRMIGAFSGGAALHSIEAVAGDVLDELEVLIDHSLVRRLDGERFGMLETIREFATERLEAEGEADTAQRAVASEMLRIAEDADAALRGPDQVRAGATFEAEHDNIRAALQWALTGGADPALGARLATKLGWFWYSHSYAVEGSAWLEAAYAAAPDDLPAEVRAMLMWRFGVLLDQRVEVGRAAELFEQAASLFRALNDESGTAAALNSWGSAVRNGGDGARARPLFEEALAIRRKLGDEAGQATALCNLGCVELDEGDVAKGRVMLQEALALDTKSGDDWAVAVDLNALGTAALDAGDLAEARDLFVRALAAFRDLGDTDRLAEVLGSLAGFAVVAGDPVRGARLTGAAEAVWGRLGIPLAPQDRARFERYQDKALEALGGDAFEQARGEGRSMTIDQALVFALAENG